MHAKALQLYLTLCNTMDCTCPGPLSMGFSRQEYWSELPFPTPGDRPYPGIKPMTPALAGGFFTDKPPGKSYESWGICKNKDFDSADLL